MATATQPASFNELIGSSEIPVFADFWAAWCGPCKVVAPAVEQLAREFKGKLMVVKINVDEKPQLAAQFGVKGIPALMLFHKGKTLWSAAGALPYETIREEVRKRLPG